MPRGRGRSRGLGESVQKLGEQIGAQLGEMIAQTVQKTLESSINLKKIARRLGSGRGRHAVASRGTCTQPGCTNPVLAKELCRSHYYRARYQAQKAGARGRKRAAAPDAT